MTADFTPAQKLYLKLISALKKRGVVTSTALGSYSTERREWFPYTDRDLLSMEDLSASFLLQTIHDYAEEKAHEDIVVAVKERTSSKKEVEKMPSRYSEAWMPAAVTLMNAMYQAVAAGESVKDLMEALEKGANAAIHERNRHQMPQQSHLLVLVQEVVAKSDPDAKTPPGLEWSKDLKWTSGHPFSVKTSDGIRLELIGYAPSGSVLNDVEVCVEAEWQGPSPNHPSFCRRASSSRVEVLIDDLLVQARATIKMVTDELKRRGDARS